MLRRSRCRAQRMVSSPRLRRSSAAAAVEALVVCRYPAGGHFGRRLGVYLEYQRRPWIAASLAIPDSEPVLPSAAWGAVQAVGRHQGGRRRGRLAWPLWCPYRVLQGFQAGSVAAARARARARARAAIAAADAIAAVAVAAQPAR